MKLKADGFSRISGIFQKSGDKGGKGPGFALTGPRNSQLMLTLDQDGYRTK